MNKNNRRTLPMVMAMLVMVTAMCAVGSAQDLNITKVASSISPMTVSGHAQYDINTGVGSNIEYDILIVNNGDLVHVISVTDMIPYPHGVETYLSPGDYLLNYGDSQAYTTYYTVNLTDLILVKGSAVEVGDEIQIRNRILVCTELGGCACETCVITVDVVEDEPPEAEFDFTPTTCGQGTLDASASTDDVGIVSWAWDFCDGTTNDYDDASGESVTYTDIGTCNVGLKVTDTIGQTHTVRHDVTLTGDPTAIAKADGSHGPIYIPEGGKTVSFDGTASYADSPATLDLSECYWTIKATTYSGLGPHNVFIDGDTTASLHVEDNYGCTATDTVQIKVKVEQEVPVLTPLGTVMLIGLLGLIGVGIIMRRR